jgi:hypothetical protein
MSLSSTEKLTMKQARERIATLEFIIEQTLWMARRYADRRMSYATCQYNDAARDALQLGILERNPDGTWWASDSMGREYAGLSEEEWAEVESVRRED